MSTTANLRSRAAGFTLVELVVTIVVTSVVVGFVAMFIVTPMQGYYAQTRRAKLVTSAEFVKRNLALDVASALPHSVRITPNALVLELLTTTGVSRYWVPADGALPPGQTLQFGSPTITPFQTVGLFGGMPPPNAYLSIGNTDTGATAYQLAPGGVMTGPSTINPQANAKGDLVTLSPAMTFTSSVSAAHHAFLVSGPVTYLCDTAAQTLRRYTNYSITLAQSAVAPPGASNSLIAEGVANCAFSKSDLAPNHGELVILRLTLTNGSDSLTFFQQAGVNGVP